MALKSPLKCKKILWPLLFVERYAMSVWLGSWRSKFEKKRFIWFYRKLNERLVATSMPSFAMSKILKIGETSVFLQPLRPMHTSTVAFLVWLLMTHPQQTMMLFRTCLIVCNPTKWPFSAAKMRNCKDKSKDLNLQVLRSVLVTLYHRWTSSLPPLGREKSSELWWSQMLIMVMLCWQLHWQL